MNRSSNFPWGVIIMNKHLSVNYDLNEPFYFRNCATVNIIIVRSANYKRPPSLQVVTGDLGGGIKYSEGFQIITRGG